MVKSTNQLIGIDLKNLEAILGQVIAKELQKLSSKKKDNNELEYDEVLTTKEVCNLLKISKTTLWRLNKRGLIIPKRLNTKTVFLRTEVLNYLKNQELC